jgi:hypothetical protein
VEVLGRHNQVLARHPVYRWPARAGRGYDAEVILDDPFVAPSHVRIEPAADGRFRIVDLQSVNGVSLPPSPQRRAEVEVGPDDLVRIGRTQIRVRACSYAVQPEMPMRAVAFYRRPLAFALVAALPIALVVWNAWITTTGREEKTFFIYPALSVCGVLALWISIWSLVGTIGGRANFAAHGFVAAVGVVAFVLTDTLFDYLSFGFDAHGFEYVDVVAAALILAYMIYRHLRLNSRAPLRRLAVLAAIASAAVCGVAAGLDVAQDSEREGRQRFNETIKAPAFLWVPGSAPEAFLAKAEKLRDKADNAVLTEPR